MNIDKEEYLDLVGEEERIILSSIQLDEPGAPAIWHGVTTRGRGVYIRSRGGSFSIRYFDNPTWNVWWNTDDRIFDPNYSEEIFHKQWDFEYEAHNQKEMFEMLVEEELAIES